MDYINNIKYFLPQKNFWKIVGAVIAAVGVPFFFMGHGGSMIGCVIIAVGLCVFIFAKDSRPSDADIDNAVAKKIKNVDEFARRGIDIREKLIKVFPPVMFSDYDYSNDDESDEELKVQRGQDRKYRSNKYAAAQIMFATEKLHIFTYRFCITKEADDEKYFEAKYTDLQNAVIEKRSRKFSVPKGKGFEEVDIEYRSIVVRDNNGDAIFEMPVHDGADVDKAVDTINRLISAKKADLEKAIEH